MKYLFWSCWSLEIATVFYWIAKEVNLSYEPDPLSSYIGLYLMIVLACRFDFDMQKLSTMMVVLPAIPLFALATLFSFSPYKTVTVKK
ncbi:MAG: hypothetical protein H7Z13_14355 [Ferruginibacter sp.]|nr:hypothetical protein [Ferruginibacter sp.]